MILVLHCFPSMTHFLHFEMQPLKSLTFIEAPYCSTVLFTKSLYLFIEPIYKNASYHFIITCFRILNLLP